MVRTREQEVLGAWIRFNWKGPATIHTCYTGAGFRCRLRGQHLVTNIDIASNSSLIFDTSLGEIELYVLGDLNFDSNSNVLTTGFAATDLAVYLAGPPGHTATFHSNGDFCGAIYGPDATVDINSNFVLHGAVAADEVLLASNTQIHYDEALRDDGLIDRFIAGHMVRGAFPDFALFANRTDPFTLLGVQRSALRSPADAHEASP